MEPEPVNALNNRLPVLLMLALPAIACSDGNEAVPAPPADDRPPIFTDRSRESGLDFVHVNGMTGELYIAEMMGGGAALFDYDNDGDLDLYVTQSGLFPPGAPGSPGDRLFRNELTPGGGTAALRFTDVTEAAGLDAHGYGMGVAAGDYDGDGNVDLYVTRLGPNAMLRNRGDGSFEEVTATAGTGDARWSIPAAFLDYDRDGRLDLYVGNYVDFRTTNHRRCPSASGLPDYCGPLAYEPEPDRLFRNRGDGTFEDVTAAAGLGSVRTNALGAIPADFDGDGWIDLYVASDGTANLLWMNQRDGTFSDRALFSGCALNAEGQPEASMGIDAGDFDDDGDEDLFMTHLREETNTLFVNRGDAVFEDGTPASGLGPPSLGYTGFGTAWLDYDNDGRLDLLSVNGAVRQIAELAERGDPFPLHQPNQLFRNLGDGRFEDMSSLAGPALGLSEVSRGAAFGDVDNDGDTDAVIVNNAGPLRLLINERGQAGHWIGLSLSGGPRGGEMTGARVGLHRMGLPVSWRRSRAAGSYASANDPRVLFGLGHTTEIEKIVVQWPDGTVEQFDPPPIDSYSVLRKGG